MKPAPNSDPNSVQKVTHFIRPSTTQVDFFSVELLGPNGEICSVLQMRPDVVLVFLTREANRFGGKLNVQYDPTVWSMKNLA